MTLPDEVLRMLNWPNTPGQERLERAIEFYGRTREHQGNYVQVAVKGREAGEQVEQAIRDLPAITVIMENATWQTWCQKTMEREMPPDMNPMEIGLTLVRIAGCGDNQDSTGLAVMAWKPREGEHQDPAVIHFGLMARDPGWAGACPQLQHADGLTALLVRSQEDEARTGAVVCIPPLYAPRITDEETDTANSEERMLMDILNWHGAGAYIRYSATQGFAKLVRQNNGAEGE